MAGSSLHEWMGRSRAPALHLRSASGTDRLLSYGELADAVRDRVSAMRDALSNDDDDDDGRAGHASAPVMALQATGRAQQLIDVLAGIEVGRAEGIAVFPCNQAWWPRERDAAFERLRPRWALQDEHRGPIVVAAGDRVDHGIDHRSVAALFDRPPVLWLATAGGDGDPTPFAYDAVQLAGWVVPDPTIRPGDRVVVSGEVGHAPTLRFVLAALAAGAEVELCDRTQLARRLGGGPLDHLCTTPPVFRRALHQLQHRGRVVPRVGRIVLHQGPVRPHEQRAWPTLLGAEVHNWISSTEAGGWLAHGSVGAGSPSLPGVEVHLDDDGLVFVSGAQSAAASTDAARPDRGWATGDVAVTQADGVTAWHSRRRDRFVAVDAIVDPVEVESVLAGNRLVAEVVVAPRPIAEGNIVVAVIVPSDPEWPPFLSDLSEELERLPPHAQVQALAIVEDIPINAAGAVHRRLVNYEEAGR